MYLTPQFRSNKYLHTVSECKSWLKPESSLHFLQLRRQTLDEVLKIPLSVPWLKEACFSAFQNPCIAHLHVYICIWNRNWLFFPHTEQQLPFTVVHHHSCCSWPHTGLPRFALVGVAFSYQIYVIHFSVSNQNPTVIHRLFVLYLFFFSSYTFRKQRAKL